MKEPKNFEEQLTLIKGKGFIISVDIESPDLTRHDRLVFAKEQMVDTFKKVFPYVLIGVGLDIKNYKQESIFKDFILTYVNNYIIIIMSIC